MPVLEISFLAGRYHATAWGRNVNEGEPEWPPSPFRLARALMDVRCRRHADIDDDSLERALLLLTGMPRFSLPPVRRMALKYYLDQGKTDGKKQAVLDAFVCMPKGAALYMELPQDAPTDALHVLETLVASLPYLGRAESWTAARLRAELPPQRRWNCRLAAAQTADPDNQTEVHTLLSPTAYADLPCLPMTGKGKKKRACSWLEALALTTGTLRADGWNRHPLLGRSVYISEDDESPSRRPSPSADAGPCCVTYAIRSTPLPSVTQTLPLAERVRIGLMSRHKRCCGGDERRISPLFSGKDTLGRPLRGHRHAFYWPCDTDGDGRLDHVRVLLPGGLTREERQSLEGLRHIWTQGAELAELIFLHCLPQASGSGNTALLRGAGAAGTAFRGAFALSARAGRRAVAVEQLHQTAQGTAAPARLRLPPALCNARAGSLCDRQPRPLRPGPFCGRTAGGVISLVIFFSVVLSQMVNKKASSLTFHNL